MWSITTTVGCQVTGAGTATTTLIVCVDLVHHSLMGLWLIKSDLTQYKCCYDHLNTYLTLSVCPTVLRLGIRYVYVLPCGNWL